MTAATPPLLVEITGVAGSGKSTLTRRLSQSIEGAAVGGFIHARKPAHLASVARAMPRLNRMLAANVVRTPRLSWPDVKLLVYVTEWDRILRRASDGRAVTLLDQGPVYALVRLRAQGRGVTRTGSFSRWWDGALDRWAGELDTVVYLDAPDEVLFDRINRRDQPHRTKGGSYAAGIEFIKLYRRLFEEVLSRLDAHGGPRIVRVDTGSTSQDAVAAELDGVLSERRVAGREAAS